MPSNPEAMDGEDNQHLGEAVKFITPRTDMERQKRKRSTSLITILSSSFSILYSMLKNGQRSRTILPLKVLASVMLVAIAIVTFFYYRIFPVLRSNSRGDSARLSSSVAALRHVKYWCLYNDVQGGQSDNFCQCPNPLEPLPPRHTHSKKYFQLHQSNVKLARAVDQKKDIVFLGDSITQHWMDRKENKIVFDKYFTKGEGKLDGLALGVSGDTAPHLLWRLQNGELPSNLKSKIYWILIGTNDFGDGCSHEIVYIGILRIIEEIQRLRPDSVLVVNSLLPRSDVMNVGDGTISGHGSVSKIWEGIQIVNSKLRDYCNTQNINQKLYYFDATDIFLRVNASNNYEQIPKEFMNDFLHPSAAGYQVWAERITMVYFKIFGKQI